MPSLQHEALLLLFRNRPALAPELLRDALHVPLPAYSEARLESSDLTDLAPAEYRADLVVLLVDGKPVLGIVVEVQLQRDERKRFTWPVYVAGLRARLYSDLIYAALSEAAKAALEDLMATGTYVIQSEFAKKHQAAGRVEGRIEGRAQAIVDFLEARGLTVSEESRSRILACTDAGQLSAWLRKAATATTVDQVF